MKTPHHLQLKHIFLTVPAALITLSCAVGVVQAEGFQIMGGGTPVTSPVDPTPTPNPVTPPVDPTPTPSPSPVMSPSPSPSPSVMPSPSVSPSPSPAPDNSSPVIQTKNLHPAQDGKSYKESIKASDIDKGDVLGMQVTQLPAGLSQTNCVDPAPASKNQVECDITGTPQTEGNYSVVVNVSDNAGHTVEKVLELKVK